MKNIAMVLGVLCVGVVAAGLARPPSDARTRDGVLAAAGALIAAQKKVPACTSVLEAVLRATAGELK